MREGMSDLVILILLLAICIGVGFSAMVKVLDSQEMGYDETLEDKSISNSSVSSADDLYTGDMNLYEALLTLQVQDEKMDFPRDIYVHGTSECTISVDGTYKNVLLANTLAFYNTVKGKWGNSPNNYYNFVYKFDEITKPDGTIVLEDKYELVKTK